VTVTVPWVRGPLARPWRSARFTTAGTVSLSVSVSVTLSLG